MLFPKTQVIIYLSDTIEIGYTHYGPTIALAGNLSAKHKIALIHDMTIELKQRTGEGRRQFGWVAFRPHTFKVGGFLGIDLKMASRFMITPAEPYNFNILFSDHDCYTRMNGVLNFVKSEWNTFVESQRKQNPQTQLNTLFNEFLQKAQIAEAAQTLRGLSIWEAGEYSLTIHAITESPQQIFSSTQRFILSQDHIATLKTNVLAILTDICGRGSIEYKFISASALK